MHAGVYSSALWQQMKTLLIFSLLLAVLVIEYEYVLNPLFFPDEGAEEATAVGSCQPGSNSDRT